MAWFCFLTWQILTHRGGERERETQIPKQAPGSELSAQTLTWGSNSECEIMNWAEVRRPTDWATQVPLIPDFKKASIRYQWFPLCLSQSFWSLFSCRAESLFFQRLKSHMCTGEFSVFSNNTSLPLLFHLHFPCETCSQSCSFVLVKFALPEDKDLSSLSCCGRPERAVI